MAWAISMSIPAKPSPSLYSYGAKSALQAMVRVCFCPEFVMDWVSVSPPAATAVTMETHSARIMHNAMTMDMPRLRARTLFWLSMGSPSKFQILFYYKLYRRHTQ